MTPAKKLVRFAAVLLVAFGLGWGIGTVVDPIVDEPPAVDGHGGEHR